MTRGRLLAKALFRNTIQKVALCILLVGIGLIVVYGLIRLFKGRQPLISLTSNQPIEDPFLTPASSGKHLRFAVATIVSAEATFSNYNLLVQKICREIGLKEAFVLRPSYTAVRHALELGQVDVALVCTGTYIHALEGNRIQLLAQPEFEEGLNYRSLLIVPEQSAATKLEDLQGGVMAFTDPESNTGRVVPTVMMAKRGLEPSTFFKKVMYTGSHDRSIRGVSLGIVDVAAVDSLVLDSLKIQEPSLVSGVRIIWASQLFGPPPIVIPRGLSEDLKTSLLQAFTTIHHDEEGKKILSTIGIKRFVTAREEDYQTAIELFDEFKKL